MSKIYNFSQIQMWWENNIAWINYVINILVTLHK